jgi:hypothetical protein
LLVPGWWFLVARSWSVELKLSPFPLSAFRFPLFPVRFSPSAFPRPLFSLPMGRRVSARSDP